MAEVIIEDPAIEAEAVKEQSDLAWDPQLSVEKLLKDRSERTLLANTRILVNQFEAGLENEIPLVLQGVESIYAETAKRINTRRFERGNHALLLPEFGDSLVSLFSKICDEHENQYIRKIRRINPREVRIIIAHAGLAGELVPPQRTAYYEEFKSRENYNKQWENTLISLANHLS